MFRSDEWDKYWESGKNRAIYNTVASFYRHYIIKRSQNYFLNKYFSSGSLVLHAGCGGGEIDKMAVEKYKVTAVDFSKNAISKYKKNNPKVYQTEVVDIIKLPFKNEIFDGVYNLGVLEHYDKRDINNILLELNRVLKKDGKMIIFWPPEFGLSVGFFKMLVYIFKNVLKISNVKFHPDEISRIVSKKEVIKIFRNAGLKVIDYNFGIRDLFTYCVIVAKKS